MPNWVACALVKAQLERFGALPAVLLGALILRLLAGVGFANYDTLYALVWGQQLSRGETPQYGIPVAPTPHPLVEALGFVLSPFGPRAAQSVTVALGFIALSGCGWVVYRLGARWFGRAAGALAAVLLLTRLPVISYGVRAYVDIPYLLLVLGALLVATRDSAAQKPALVLLLLAFAGLLRPEAWVFSGLYWLYLAFGARCNRSQLVRLALLACAAPLIWVLSDWLATGEPFWSLTNTRAHRQRAGTDHGGSPTSPSTSPAASGRSCARPSSSARPSEGCSRCCGSPPRARRRGDGRRRGRRVRRLRQRRTADQHALRVPRRGRCFASSAAPASSAGRSCPPGDLAVRPGWRAARWWRWRSSPTRPAQYRALHGELDALSRQQSIQRDLVALVHSGAISLRCGPVGVPNHRPIPLLALELKSSPANVVSAQARTIARGTYVQPASGDVRKEYILDKHDPGTLTATVPPGFALAATNRSWLVYRRCVGL